MGSKIETKKCMVRYSGVEIGYMENNSNAQKNIIPCVQSSGVQKHQTALVFKKYRPVQEKHATPNPC